METGALKSTWPELVGRTAEEAKNVVREQRSDVFIEVMHEHDPATEDYDESRVRIVHNSAGNVVFPPCCG